ncbi:MAG: hypothetical protein WAO83_04925 [Fuerstiella sp.]
MINVLKKSILLITALSSVGCTFPWLKQEPRSTAPPALSMNITSNELVDHLNRKTQGLEGWRCTSTRMSVRLPNGLSQRLKGAIACQAPNYFRLTASNVIATADLGSNNSRCWVYVKPGESAVMTWKHEDTELLQQIPSGVPYIDPNWLMLVLGVTPLDPADYEISSPAGARELWLAAIEQGASGRPIRRVIKVDVMSGDIREHALYDSERNPLVRAQLSGYRWYNQKRIPQSVKLMFTQMDSEMTLTFDGIETNPHLPDELWRMPDHNLKVVDLGEVIRSRMLVDRMQAPDSNSQFYQPPTARLQPPVFEQPTRSAFAPPSETAFLDDSAEELEEPDWDNPISQSRTIEPPAEQRQMSPTPRRPSMFGFFNRSPHL